MNTDKTFTSLFESRSTAFIGASRDIFKWGFNILHNIVLNDYSGTIHPVNPQGGSWYGRTVYKNISSIDGPVDLAIIVVPKQLTLEAIHDCAAKGVGAAVVITAGFSETGTAGALLEKELVSAARSGGMRITGPNTMGVYSSHPYGLHALMASFPLKKGGVSIITQSGNLGSSISYRFTRRGIGISRLISSGNEADLTIEDYLEMLDGDERTTLICLYVEGLRDGRRFFETARRITLRKPVILLKGGTSSTGAQAAMSHTGAIAGDAVVFSAMCSQAGIIQAATMDEMIDIAGILVSQPEITGTRTGIITQGGGWGVVATDHCAYWGLEITRLSDSVVDKLDRILPPFWSRRNPIDLVAPGHVTVISDAIDILLESGEMDSILVLGLGYMTVRARRWMQSPILPCSESQTNGTRMIEEELKLIDLIRRQIKHYNKPVVPVIDLIAFDEVMENNPAQYLDAYGIMAYASPENAVRALAKAAGYYMRRSRMLIETK